MNPYSFDTPPDSFSDSPSDYPTDTDPSLPSTVGRLRGADAALALSFGVDAKSSDLSLPSLEAKDAKETKTDTKEAKADSGIGNGTPSAPSVSGEVSSLDRLVVWWRFPKT